MGIATVLTLPAGIALAAASVALAASGPAVGLGLALALSAGVGLALVLPVGVGVALVFPVGVGVALALPVGVGVALALPVGLGVALASRRRALRRLEQVALAEHELRGPIAVLSLTRERMEREATGRRYARALEVEVERLKAALADLTAARTGERPSGAGIARDRSSDLRSFAGGALAGWAPALRAAGRRTRFDWRAGAVRLPHDRGRVAQALGNLVANAAEHGGGEVEVRGRRVPGGVRVEVRNGLPIEARPDQTRDRGLGLPIAMKAARELGGDVRTARDARTFRAALELPISEASLRLRDRIAEFGPRSPAQKRPKRTTNPRPMTSGNPGPAAPRPRAPASRSGAPAPGPGGPASRPLPARPARPPQPAPKRPAVPPRRVIGNRRRM